MKAAVLVATGQPLEIEELTIGKPGPHEVLIRTAACGLCHSDLHFIDGAYPHPLPAVPGHEAAGIVEQIGSEVRTVKVGDAVVTCLSAFCGHCEFCVTGRMALCMGAETRRAPGEPPRLTRTSARCGSPMVRTKFTRARSPGSTTPATHPSRATIRPRSVRATSGLRDKLCSLV